MSFVITSPEMVAAAAKNLAEASTQSTLVDAHGALLRSILNALEEGRIGSDVATSLVHKVGNVGLAVAEKKTGSALEAIQAFVDEVQREQPTLPHELTRDLLGGAETARRELSGM